MSIKKYFVCDDCPCFHDPENEADTRALLEYAMNTFM